MAYRTEKNGSTGQYEYVIDGFEKGIADSPYQGIANIRNLNVRYYAGVAYVNYKRKACTITGSTMGIPAYATESPQGIIYISDKSNNIFKQTAANSSTFAALTGNSNGTGTHGLQWWNNYLLAFGPTQISICGDGTGDSGIISTNWDTPAGASGVWPLSNALIGLGSGVTVGQTSNTITSYTDAQGTSRTFWNGPSGTYLIALGGPNGQLVVGTFTQGSNAFSYAPAATFVAASSAQVIVTGQRTAIGLNQSIVAAQDGNVYFCNGANVGSFIENDGFIFNKTNFSTFSFNTSALGLPTSDTAGWLTELRGQLFIAGQFRVYPWNYTDAHWTTPIPLNENITKIINILNNVYIFAGNKGNIYITDGTTATPFKKMPDYIAGIIDPAWYIGGVMQHRQNLYFQALAVNSQTGVNIFSGIFSLGLNTGNGLTLETAGSLVMEAQNSFGLNNVNSTLDGLLIDNNETSTLNYDNYYSAWNNGSGGIDFNDTTLWSNNEPIIETDLISVGTALQQKTFSNIEFKLDQPMKNGDSITVMARQSLSETYIPVGTTSTNVLSFAYTPLIFENFQWIQLTITLSCNSSATSSSFMRLREIRIR